MQRESKYKQQYFQKEVGTILPTLVFFTALILDTLFQKSEESKDGRKKKVLTLACIRTYIK